MRATSQSRVLFIGSPEPWAESLSEILRTDDVQVTRKDVTKDVVSEAKASWPDLVILVGDATLDMGRRFLTEWGEAYSVPVAVAVDPANPDARLIPVEFGATDVLTRDLEIPLLYEKILRLLAESKSRRTVPSGQVFVPSIPMSASDWRESEPTQHADNGSYYDDSVNTEISAQVQLATHEPTQQDFAAARPGTAAALPSTVAPVDAHPRSLQFDDETIARHERSVELAEGSRRSTPPPSLTVANDWSEELVTRQQPEDESELFRGLARNAKGPATSSAPPIRSARKGEEVSRRFATQRPVVGLPVDSVVSEPNSADNASTDKVPSQSSAAVARPAPADPATTDTVRQRTNTPLLHGSKAEETTAKLPTRSDVDEDLGASPLALKSRTPSAKPLHVPAPEPETQTAPAPVKSLRPPLATGTFRSVSGSPATPSDKPKPNFPRTTYGAGASSIPPMAAKRTSAPPQLRNSPLPPDGGKFIVPGPLATGSQFPPVRPTSSPPIRVGSVPPPRSTPPMPGLSASGRPLADTLGPEDLRKSPLPPQPPMEWQSPTLGLATGAVPNVDVARSRATTADMDIMGGRAASPFAATAAVSTTPGPFANPSPFAPAPSGFAPTPMSAPAPPSPFSPPSFVQQPFSQPSPFAAPSGFSSPSGVAASGSPFSAPTPPWSGAASNGYVESAPTTVDSSPQDGDFVPPPTQFSNRPPTNYGARSQPPPTRPWALLKPVFYALGGLALVSFGWLLGDWAFSGDVRKPAAPSNPPVQLSRPSTPSTANELPIAPPLAPPSGRDTNPGTNVIAVPVEAPAVNPADDPTLPRDPTQRAEVLVERAQVLLDSGDATSAGPLFQSAAQWDAENPHAAHGAALCFLAARDGAQALAWAEKAINLRRRRAPYQVTLGDAYALTGNQEAARAAWQRARTLDPRNSDARDRLRAP